MPAELRTTLQIAVHGYRAWRRRGHSPEMALQQIHTELLIAATQVAAEGNAWAALELEHFAALAQQHLSLLSVRVGINTAQERFWVTGRLSGPTDHLLFLTHINGNRYWHRTCRDLACAIKHGIGAFEFPEWIAFSIERPDGEVVLAPVGPGITLEAVYRMTDGS